MTDDIDHKQEKAEKLSFFQVLGSVLAGALGVQSSKNRERDFAQNSFMPFIVGGVIFTVLFVGSIVLLVKVFLADY
ncbi:MAG: DUF2970 domain-containing protein [Pseudomonadales bacterium]